MSEHDPGSHDGTPPPTDRLSAHERLSTGGLSRWMRACATHPWRVVASWVGIVVVLVFLVATVGGGLRDEFEIPGSDTQRATDLIEAEFSSEQGSVLNLVFAAPAGEQLDTPERQAAIEEALQRLQSDEFAPKGDEIGIESVGDPFEDDTVSDDGRIAYTEAQFSDLVDTADRDQVVAVEDAVRETVEPAGITAEFNGEAEFPPIEQGTAGAARPLHGADRAPDRVPHGRRDVDPARARADGGRDRVPAPLHPRRAHRHQHDHAAARLDDRARGRDRLLALHRDPVPAVPARGDGAGGRRHRGGRLGGPGGASSPA